MKNNDKFRKFVDSSLLPVHSMKRRRCPGYGKKYGEGKDFNRYG
jgi:hypothetical protein